MKVCSENGANLLDRAEHFAGEIEAALPAFKPTHHAGRDAEISIVDRPREQTSLDRHSQRRGDQRKPVEDRTDLRGSGLSHCSDRKQG